MGVKAFSTAALSWGACERISQLYREQRQLRTISPVTFSFLQLPAAYDLAGGQRQGGGAVVVEKVLLRKGVEFVANFQHTQM